MIWYSRALDPVQSRRVPKVNEGEAKMSITVITAQIWMPVKKRETIDVAGHSRVCCFVVTGVREGEERLLTIQNLTSSWLGAGSGLSSARKRRRLKGGCSRNDWFW
jgi:hypothetical protein